MKHLSCPPSRISPLAAWGLWLAGLCGLLAGLAGCTTVPEGGEVRRAQVAPEQADPERRARLRLELASAYFGRGQTATALDEVNQAIASAPRMSEAYNLRGLIYASMGEPERAMENFRRALDINPRDADTLHNYAWYQCQQRRFAEADTLFQQALSVPQYRDTQRTLLARGVCQARDGLWEKAEDTLTRAYELNPGNPAAAVNLSEVLLRRGQVERARFYVRRVNEVPEFANAQTLWLAARVEHRAGNVLLAREMGQKMAERFPNSPEAMRFARGQYDEQ